MKASLELLGLYLQPKHFEGVLLAWPTPDHWAIISQRLTEAELAILKAVLSKTIQRVRSNYLRERELSEGELDDFIAARVAARKNRNWAEADRIRDKLAAMGFVLKDNKDGTTTWEIKR